MNKKYIVANWKMSPATLAEAQQILDSTSSYLESFSEVPFNLIFCPPFVFLEEVGKIIKNSTLDHKASLGAQDIFWDDKGADTGEVSGPMLSGLGVRHVIIGHSERRWKLGETDEIINKKLKAALRNDILPIVCIGEKSRSDNYKEFLKNQANKTFDGIDKEDIKKCLIAYEPVWAISSNPDSRPDTPESALESITIIRETLDSDNFLYGGSVNSKNIYDFISKDEIKGVLVGSASVNREEFLKLLSVIK